MNANSVDEIGNLVEHDDTVDPEIAKTDRFQKRIKEAKFETRSYRTIQKLLGFLFVTFALSGLVINFICVLNLDPTNKLVKHAMTIESSNYKASVDFLNDISFNDKEVRFNLFLSTLVKILALRVGYLMI